jgi:hypothetical protein
MYSPLHDLARHHPAYNFGRLDHLPPYLDRWRADLDEFEELERRKPIRDECEEEWRRFDRRPVTLIGEIAAVLLVLFALWGSVEILYRGLPDQLAGQEPQPLAAAAELTSR